MNEELIVVKQLPIIEERLRRMSATIDAKIEEALKLACCEETVIEVKRVRAELNAQFNELEDQRKAVKKTVLAPYEAFETVYKECVTDKFKAADATLKGEIDAVEDKLKAETEEKLRVYYTELSQAYGIDFVSFERLNVKITKTASVKSLKEYMQKTLSAVMDDLAVISKQEYKDEILAEYKQSLNLKQAITHVSDIHAAIEAEKAKQADNVEQTARQAEAVKKVEAFTAPAAVAAPPENVDPVLTLSFRVTAPKSKLRELKKFLIDGGYDFE